MNKIFPLLLLLLPLCTVSAQQSFDTVALYNSALSLHSVHRIVMISFEPGFEQLSEIAYLTQGKGAQVSVIYVTNGEKGVSDIRTEYPHHLAALRREEATSAISKLGAESYFLNFPDVPEQFTADQITATWNQDSLRVALRNLLLQIQPGVIFITRDQKFGKSSQRMAMVKNLLMRMVKEFQQKRKTNRAIPVITSVLVDEAERGEIMFPVRRFHPMIKKSFLEIGNETGTSYRTMKFQRQQWSEVRGRYSILFNASRIPPKTVDRLVVASVGTQVVPLTSLLRKITLALQAIALKKSGAPSVKAMLLLLTSAEQQCDTLLRNGFRLPYHDYLNVIHWKNSLEKVKTIILNIQADYTFSEHILAPRQLMFFRVDTIQGMSSNGKTDLYIPAVEYGWGLNEKADARVPLQMHAQYRLLSPNTIAFHLPASLQGLTATQTTYPLEAIIIHRSVHPESSFVYRIIHPVRFSPRFSIEVLNPLVATVNGERLVVRLINHSRDPVSDNIYVNDTLVHSTVSRFQLRFKESTHQDTLVLQWNSAIPSGTYIIPITIADQTVASFVARTLEVKIDSTKRIGILSGLEYTVTAESMRRLGYRYTMLKDLDDTVKIRYCDVIIVDERASTLLEEWDTWRMKILQAAESGKHIVILAQDKSSWNSKPLISSILLDSNRDNTLSVPPILDTTSLVLNYPNHIAPGDFQDWIDSYSTHTIRLIHSEQATILISSGTNYSPILISSRRGSGMLYYCNLTFSTQLLNINQTAFQLLSNIISN